MLYKTKAEKDEERKRYITKSEYGRRLLMRFRNRSPVTISINKIKKLQYTNSITLFYFITIEFF